MVGGEAASTANRSASRVLFMGAPYTVPAYQERPLIDCFRATGDNTGNLLIGHGLHSQLDYDTVTPYRGSMTAQFITENFDQVVIAAANFLYPKFDFGYLSSLLEGADVPVFMVGLGAQLPADTKELKDIPVGTWRLVQLAAERSHSIGVRGEFTATLLRRAGIDNVQVTGCPSLYTNLCDPRKLRLSNVPGRIVLNGSRNVVAHASDPQAARRAEAGIVQWAMAHQATYVLQNEQPEMQLANGESEALYQRELASLGVFFGREPTEIAGFYRRFGKTFFDIGEWFAWISDADLSVGSRFHGNVAALLNGVPAIVVTHDSRTRELCEFASIPNIDISRIEDVDPLRWYGDADFDAYEVTLARNIVSYREFLDANGIRHRFSPCAPL